MKKYFLIWALCAYSFGQTLDINALRMAQSNWGSNSAMNSQTSNVSQSQAKVVVDAPIDPTQYKIGPGDQFRVNIISSNDISISTLVVSPSGDILITNIGIVYVNALTLADAMDTIKSAILEANPSAKVHILLSEIREFKIKVIGQLQKPGLYTVTPVSRVSELYNDIFIEDTIITNNFQNHEEMYPEISTRNITILRNNKSIPVDLEKFGLTGLDTYNPFLQQGDIVNFPLKDHIVRIFGGIKIPGNYEFITGESLSQFVELAGGLRPDADPEKIEITRFISSTKRYTFVTSMSAADTILISSEDHIMIRYDQEYKRQDIVYISGEVKYPGVYAIEPGITTIGDVLKKVGGFTSRADHTKLIINNSSISSIPDREKNRILLIPDEIRSPDEKAYIKARMLTEKGTIKSSSLEQAESLMNLPIVNDDHIIILENFSYIEILGGVLKPGRYPYKSNITLKEYIDLAGGITKTATRKLFIIKSGTGQRLPIKKSVKIENGDTIFIPEKMEYNKWIIIKDILAGLAQIATLVVVAQNVIGG